MSSHVGRRPSIKWLDEKHTTASPYWPKQSVRTSVLAFLTLIPVAANLSNCPLARWVTNHYLSARLQGESLPFFT